MKAKGIRFNNVILPLVALGLGLGSLPGPAAAQDSTRLKRQIGVMERIIDEVLVESPNYLVGGRKVTNGLYLEGFGLLFTFEAGLTQNVKEKEYWDVLKNFKIEHQDGKTIIYHKDDGDDEEDEKNAENWRALIEEDQQKKYEDGKKELAEVLVDYGETLGGLSGNEHVAIAAFIRTGEFFLDGENKTLVVQARMSDLRDFSAGKISRDAMEERIEIQEY